jgi:multiple sugar transport system substrate-binding protein
LVSIGLPDDAEDCEKTSSADAGRKITPVRDCVGYAEVAKQFQTANPGIRIRHRAYRHEWMKAHLKDFLQSEEAPDVLVWSAGTHVGEYKDQLAKVGDSTDQVDGLRRRFLEHVRVPASRAREDEALYFLPFKTYVWAFYYLESVWNQHSPTSAFLAKMRARTSKNEPDLKDMAELIELARAMKQDGLEPIAFGNAHGWPALGYFDAINMRVSGHACHTSLLLGDADWETKPVTKERH